MYVLFVVGWCWGWVVDCGCGVWWLNVNCVVLFVGWNCLVNVVWWILFDVGGEYMDFIILLLWVLVVDVLFWFGGVVVEWLCDG